MLSVPKPGKHAKRVAIVAAYILINFVVGALLIEATKAVFSSQPEGVHTYDLIGDPLSALRMNPFADARQYLGA